MHLRPVDALALSSPALDPGLHAVQKILLATLPRLVPNLRVGNASAARFGAVTWNLCADNQFKFAHCDRRTFSAVSQRTASWHRHLCPQLPHL